MNQTINKKDLEFLKQVRERLDREVEKMYIKFTKEYGESLKEIPQEKMRKIEISLKHIEKLNAVIETVRKENKCSWDILIKAV